MRLPGMQGRGGCPSQDVLFVRNCFYMKGIEAGVMRTCMIDVIDGVGSRDETNEQLMRESVDVHAIPSNVGPFTRAANYSIAVAGS